MTEAEEAGSGLPVSGVLYLMQTSLLSRRRSMASLNVLNEGMRGSCFDDCVKYGVRPECGINAVRSREAAVRIPGWRFTRIFQGDGPGGPGWGFLGGLGVQSEQRRLAIFRAPNASR